jgi:hypothetical protein
VLTELKNAWQIKQQAQLEIMHKSGSAISHVLLIVGTYNPIQWR